MKDKLLQVNIIWAALITLIYIVIKVLLLLILEPILDSNISNVYFEIELGEIISTFSTLILIYIFFGKVVFLPENTSNNFSLLNRIMVIILTTISLKIFLDPFIRYDFVLKTQEIQLKEISKVYLSIPVFLKLARTVIFQPIFEEVFFRKIIFVRLLSKYSKFWIASAFSSILFALTHLSIPSIFPSFCLGLLTSYILFRTKNIWYSIFSHIVFNMIWGLIYINPKIYWATMEYLNYGIGYWICFVVGSITLIFSIKKID